MRVVRGFIEQLQVTSNRQVKPQVKRSPALTAQLEGSELGTLLIIQSFRPDWFFSTERLPISSSTVASDRKTTRTDNNIQENFPGCWVSRT
jgi:hypothetical protein